VNLSSSFQKLKFFNQILEYIVVYLLEGRKYFSKFFSDKDLAFDNQTAFGSFKPQNFPLEVNKVEGI